MAIWGNCQEPIPKLVVCVSHLVGTELRDQDLNYTDENEEINLKERKRSKVTEWQEGIALHESAREPRTVKI